MLFNQSESQKRKEQDRYIQSRSKTSYSPAAVLFQAAYRRGLNVVLKGDLDDLIIECSASDNQEDVIDVLQLAAYAQNQGMWQGQVIRRGDWSHSWYSRCRSLLDGKIIDNLNDETPIEVVEAEILFEKCQLCGREFLTKTELISSGEWLLCRSCGYPDKEKDIIDI